MLVEVTPEGTTVPLKFRAYRGSNQRQVSFDPEPAADNFTPPEFGSPLNTSII